MVVTSHIEAEHLTAQLGQRPAASMTYPTAVVAGLRADGAALFPSAVQWLRTHQHPDGSWGGAIFHPQDRFVSTLAAVLALHGLRTNWTSSAVANGPDYLRRHDQTWADTDTELIGFGTTEDTEVPPSSTLWEPR